LLVELAKKTEVDKIFCLVRAKNEEDAFIRLKKVFELHNDYFDPKKIIPIVGELKDSELATHLINNEQLKEVDTIIHSAANTSFSKIYDNLVEQINITGTRQILKWAQTLKKLDLFTYVGTATICGSTIKDCIVTEDMSPNIASQHFVRYSYTKMMGELLLKEYLPADKILVVRPSIIMGDSRPWIPRSYVILWALATLNELRLFPANPNVNMDIIPIDYATNSIVELVFNKHRKHTVYHISSGPQSCTTPQKVINAIKDFFPEKIAFQFVPKGLLTDMKKWSKNSLLLSEQSPLYQYKNYLDYWIDNFGDNTKIRTLLYALEPYINFMELGQIFDNTRLLEDTRVGHSIPTHEYLKNCGKYIEAINILEGAVDF